MAPGTRGGVGATAPRFACELLPADDGGALARRPADDADFAEHLRRCGGGDSVAFENLGGDATLVSARRGSEAVLTCLSPLNCSKIHTIMSKVKFTGLTQDSQVDPAV